MVSLAKLFSIEELSEIFDPKNKIEDQLYQYNILDLFSKNSLVKCKLCAKVLGNGLYLDMNCDKGDLKMDGLGQTIRKHQL